MEKIILKNSDLNVSRICFGGCPMGGYGWGDVSKEELLKAVNFAVDNGINFFDTADTYGLGESERTLAEALGKRRKDAVIATKFGVRMENGNTFYDNSKEYMTLSVEGSLKRLKTDYIDLYQLHYRDDKTSIEEVIYNFKELKKQGKIREYGLSNVHEKDAEELSNIKHNCVSFQDEYSLACRKNEEDMLKLSKIMTPLTWGSLGQGILTGKYDVNSKFDSNDRRSREVYVNFHGEKLKKNMEIVEVMREISKISGKTIPSIAIRFILDYLKNSVVIAGMKNISQVQSNLDASGWALSESDVSNLKQSSI
ncbi:MAG: aldo/keto reductase [Bacillota bacterium]